LLAASCRCRLHAAAARLSEAAVERRHTLAIDPRDIGKHPKSRDLQVSTLYNVNIQPAMVCPISFGESS
jgi:hypothetical protein